jgi:hypothetical protein
MTEKKKSDRDKQLYIDYRGPKCHELTYMYYDHVHIYIHTLYKH